MEDKEFIFLAGLHCSGTSLLHEIIRDHPDITGLTDTGVPEDEGQHLQTVFEPGNTFGGPGRFVFDERSHMDESHPLATDENANTIMNEWVRHLDLSCRYIVEKSPPNIVRSRFLQKLFPKSRFIVILRHPLAVSYATHNKWPKTGIPSLLEHVLLAYEIFLKDMQKLHSVYILRYEELVHDPQGTIDDIFRFLELAPVKVSQDVRSNINEKYFMRWENTRKHSSDRNIYKLTEKFESRMNRFGYSIAHYNDIVPVSLLGAHHNAHVRPLLPDQACQPMRHPSR